MKRKGFLSLILIIILVALAAAAGYFYSKGEVDVNQAISQIKDFFTETKLTAFVDTENRFEFKYPDGWYPYSEGNSILLLKTAEKPVLEGTEGYAYGDQIIVNVSDIKDPAGNVTTKEGYIEKHFPATDVEGNVIKKETVTRGEKEMLRVEVPQIAVDGYILSYVYFEGDNVYTINLYPYNPETKDEDKNVSDLEKVVESFKLINNE